MANTRASFLNHWSTQIEAWSKTRPRPGLVLELRNRHFFALDLLLLAFIPSIALALRLEGWDWPPHVIPSLLLFTVMALLLKPSLFYKFCVYDRYWRSANANDFNLVVKATLVSTIVLTAGVFTLDPILSQYDLAIYRTVPIIDGVLTCVALVGTRLAYRELYRWLRERHRMAGGRRVLIVGAGEAGTLVAHEMRVNLQLNMEPVAFADDNLAKVGSHIQGLPVLGTTADVPKLVNKFRIQRIIVAMPGVPLRRREEIVSICKQTGVVVDSVPGIYEILAGNKTVSQYPRVDINYLLRRKPIIIDQTEIAACLGGATILVTGAGGSIGSELCRQVARLKPKELILLGHGENTIFDINLDLKLSHPDLITYPVIADIRDRDRIRTIFEKYRPDVVFHAAAHKHVPLMEANVEEAITNNVLGTHSVLQAANECGVSRFVLISTDKAVNPTSVMGATKRLAELLVVAAAHHTDAAYMAVRFGNVLGSRGSVIPVFLQQISAGGPITVTNAEMRRYFMTIPEAVQLVLQAAVVGNGGEVFVLDMGEPIRIVDMATDLIKLCGLEPERDIKIEIVGARPGEKLNEQLFSETECYQRTKQQKIFVAVNGNASEAETVAQLVDLARQMQTQASGWRVQADVSMPAPQPRLSGTIDNR